MSKGKPPGRTVPLWLYAVWYVWGWITYWPWQVIEMKRAGMIHTGFMEWTFPDEGTDRRQDFR